MKLFVFRPGMCRTCGCPKSGHLDSDGKPCLTHENCHRYKPLGREIAERLNAVQRKIARARPPS